MSSPIQHLQPGLLQGLCRQAGRQAGQHMLMPGPVAQPRSTLLPEQQCATEAAMALAHSSHCGPCGQASSPPAGAACSSECAPGLQLPGCSHPSADPPDSRGRRGASRQLLRMGGDGAGEGAALIQPPCAPPTRTWQAAPIGLGSAPASWGAVASPVLSPTPWRLQAPMHEWLPPCTWAHAVQASSL